MVSTWRSSGPITGLSGHLFLAEGHHVLAQQVGQYQGVQQALVVEHEYCRAFTSQVSGPFHLEVQSGKGTADIADQAGHPIGIAIRGHPESPAQHTDHRGDQHGLAGQSSASHGFHAGQPAALKCSCGQAIGAGVHAPVCPMH